MRIDLCISPRVFSREEVLARLPEVRAVFDRHGVQLAYLIGSVLSDTAGPLSDVDIAVLPDPETYRAFDTYTAIYGDLVDLFGADNVDVVMLNEASLSLKATAVTEGVLVIGQGEEIATRYAEQVLAAYADTANWRDENWDYLVQLIHHGVSKEFNMISRERVERFVFIIRDAVRELEALRLPERGLEAYLGDKIARALSEHYLRLAIEAALDLGRHVIVATGLGAPQEYKAVPGLLRDHHIVPKDLGEKLIGMAGMRNVLVHLYWDIDYQKLYNAITSELDTFEEYIRCVFDYIATRGAT